MEQERNQRQRVSQAEVQQYLAKIDYPANKQDLVDHAKDQGAPDEVISILEKLPNQEYDNPTDISEAMEDME